MTKSLLSGESTGVSRTPHYPVEQSKMASNCRPAAGAGSGEGLKTTQAHPGAGIKRQIYPLGWVAGNASSQRFDVFGTSYKNCQRRFLYIINQNRGNFGGYSETFVLLLVDKI